MKTNVLMSMKVYERSHLGRGSSGDKNKTTGLLKHLNWRRLTSHPNLTEVLFFITSANFLMLCSFLMCTYSPDAHLVCCVLYYLGNLIGLQLLAHNGSKNALLSLAYSDELRQPFDCLAEGPCITLPFPVCPFPVQALDKRGEGITTRSGMGK